MRASIVSDLRERQIQDLANLIDVAEGSASHDCACMGRPFGSTECYCQIAARARRTRIERVAAKIVDSGYERRP